MKKDYHAILGVKPGASAKEIRSAYKRLARRHHPDVNPGDTRAEETFKEINEAYEVLSDPEKRRRWEAGDPDFDSFLRREAGMAGAGRGAGRFRSYGAAGEADLEELFGDLFGAAGGFHAMGGTAGPRSRARGADLECEATLSFEQAAGGTTLRIPLARSDTCGTCGGSGRRDAPGRRGGAARFCPDCGGTGVRRVSEDIQVRIRPGAEDGSRMRVAGKGEAGVGGRPPGDLLVRLRVSPHPYLRREGRDVILDVPLTIVEATLGTRVDVPTIEGKVTLTVPPGSNSGQRLRLKGRGLPSPRGEGRGDQIVVLQIVTPKDLDASSRRSLEQLQRSHPTDPRAGLGW